MNAIVPTPGTASPTPKLPLTVFVRSVAIGSKPTEVATSVASGVKPSLGSVGGGGVHVEQNMLRATNALLSGATGGGGAARAGRGDEMPARAAGARYMPSMSAATACAANAAHAATAARIISAGMWRRTRRALHQAACRRASTQTLDAGGRSGVTAASFT